MAHLSPRSILLLAVLALGGLATPAAAVLPNHMWSFEDASYNTADSGTPGGLTAVVGPGATVGASGAPTILPGVYGTAVRLNANSTSYVDFGTAGQFGTGDFSVGLYFNTTANATYFDLIGNRADGSHGNFLAVRMRSNGAITVEIDQDGNGTNYAALSSSWTGFNNGQWHYLYVTRRGKVIKLYINNMLQGTAASTGVTNLNSPRPLKLGRTYGGFPDVVIYAEEARTYNVAVGELYAPPAVTVEATGPQTAVNIQAGSAQFTPVAFSFLPPVISNNAPATFPVGTTTVTYSATDAAGNTATATQLVTVVDTTPPVLAAQLEVAVMATSPDGAEVYLNAPAATDLVSGSVSVVGTPESGSVFPVGTTAVTWTATDAAGNSSSSTQLVTVRRDSQPPVVTAPAAITTEATGPQTAVAIGSATATDDIEVASLSNDAPATFPLGNTTVTWTARDAAGNVGIATQTVLVRDTTAPVVTAPAKVVVDATGSQTAVDLGNATASDLVGVVSLTNDAPATYPVSSEARVVTWTARDAAGNVGIATQTVRVGDGTAPVVTPPADVIAEAAGPQTAVELGDAIATDAVGVVLLINDAPVDYPVGSTTVTWTARDAAGNSSSATQTVTITDLTAPVVVAPAEVLLEATALLTPAALGAPIVTESVGIAAVENDAPDVYPVGVTTVTWTAMDLAGNVGIATQTVTITDLTAPAITAPADLTVEATGVLSPVTLGVAATTDLVGPVVVTNNAPATFPIGLTAVIWTATDAHGNSSSATQQVLVRDTTAPVVAAPAAVTTEATGIQTSVAIGAATAADAVGLVSLTSNAPATFPVGATTVTWTARDAAGNVGTAAQQILVRDTTAPTLNAALIRVGRGHGDDDDDGEGNRYRVAVSATDAVDARPVISALITHPYGPTTQMTVSYKRERKNRIEIKQEKKKRLQVRLEGPSETALRALWAQVLAEGGFRVSDGQVVQLSPKKEKNEGEAQYKLDHNLNLTSAKGTNLKLLAWAVDAQGNRTETAEVLPPRSGRDDDDRVSKLVAEVQPTAFALHQNYPNPFNPSTTITYALVEAAEVRLAIYNVAGQQVRELVTQAQEPGMYRVQWDGRDGSGQVVANGLYLYRLQAGIHTAVQKMLFAK